jgi:hypothetical protein
MLPDSGLRLHLRFVSGHRFSDVESGTFSDAAFSCYGEWEFTLQASALRRPLLCALSVIAKAIAKAIT